MLALDPAAALRDITAVSLPFFQDADRHAAGLEYYGRLSARLPDTWWVHQNLSVIAALAGDTTRAADAHRRAEELGIPQQEPQVAQPGSQEAIMKEGLDLLNTRGDPVAAAAQFRRVLEISPTHYGAHYQLATALDRAGKPADARPLWEEVLRMAEGYKDQQTAETARQRLQQRP